MRDPGDKGSLTVVGSDTYGVSVVKPDKANKPNKLLVGSARSPVGVGGTKQEIVEYGSAGLALFGSSPGDGNKPPYYEMFATGEANSSYVQVVLTCGDKQ